MRERGKNQRKKRRWRDKERDKEIKGDGGSKRETEKPKRLAKVIKWKQNVATGSE